ncbi:MAG: uL30 family ribosomal protein [archaeon]
MIIAIRISGQVGLTEEIKETLHRIKLRRKYSAVLLQETTENTKLLKKIRNNISYGKISEETLANLLARRAQPIDKNKKVDAKKVMSEIEKQPLEKLGLKPFFRLHPPRKGIESKKHAGVGKGVLGENEKINELVEKML